MKGFVRILNAVGTAGSFVALVVYSAQAADQASIARGAKTWADNCDRCHEMRDPRDFDANLWRVIVTHMRQRAGLTGQEARDVLEFLQQSSASAPSSISTVSSSATVATVAAVTGGKQIYEGTCIACHGADGKGAIRGVPDFTEQKGALSLPDSVLLERIERGFQTPSSPMAMPPKGGNPTLTEADLKAVLQHIRTTFGR